MREHNTLPSPTVRLQMHLPVLQDLLCHCPYRVLFLRLDPLPLRPFRSLPYKMASKKSTISKVARFTFPENVIHCHTFYSSSLKCTNKTIKTLYPSSIHLHTQSAAAPFISRSNTTRPSGVFTGNLLRMSWVDAFFWTGETTRYRRHHGPLCT